MKLPAIPQLAIPTIPPQRAIPLPATVSGTPIGYTAANPYRDSYSNTLADVANYYWKTDLRTLTNNVPTTSNDPAYWQHMVTFGVSIGLKGTLDPVLDLPRLTAGTPNVNGTTGWPDPTNAEDPDRIDDLFHASVNGHGKFIAALNPTQFADGLRAALAAIAEVPASNSNASANSTSLDTDSRIFQAKYRSGKWTGELLAYSIDASTGVISSTPSWSASAVNSCVRIEKYFDLDRYLRQWLGCYVPDECPSDSTDNPDSKLYCR